MAGRTLTAQDCHTIMASLIEQATGQANVVVTDTSSFVSAGETVLATGVENTLNSLSIIMGNTYVAVRPYNARFRIINAINSGAYTSRLRKISYYSKLPQASGFYNTQDNINLGMGLTAGQNKNSSGSPTATKSMWEQNPPVPLEMNFAGRSTWQYSEPYYEDQLKEAFRDEKSFSTFLNGYLVEAGNDMESQKEAFNNMVLLNYMAGIYDMSEQMKGSVVNLTEEFNKKFGTSYTSAQLRSTYLKDFLAFFVATVKKMSNRMTERSLAYHWSPTKTVNGENYALLRHTYRDCQRLMLYSDLFTDAESLVLPEIFNDDLLKIENYEGVTYWQSNASDDERPSINITPAIPDPTTGKQKSGNPVKLDYVVGVLFDVDACMTDYQLDRALSTPVEARKGYRNVWYTFSRNAINDFTEKGILFIMADTTEGAGTKAKAAKE